MRRSFRQVGRRPGKSGVGYTLTRDIVLAAYGWTPADLQHTPQLDPAEQNQAPCNDTVDVIIFEAGHPNGLTEEATTSCHARLVRVAGRPIDHLLSLHRFYVATVIPGGFYAGNPADVRSIGTRAILVTSSDQSDERAYAVVKAVFENFTDFRRLHPARSTLAIKDMVPSEAVIPIHPGAPAIIARLASSTERPAVSSRFQAFPDRPHGVPDGAAQILDLAFGLVGPARRLQLGVADSLADSRFHLALDLLHRSDDAVLVHGAYLSIVRALFDAAAQGGAYPVAALSTER